MGHLAPFIQPEEASEAVPMAKIFLQVTIFLCNFIVVYSSLSQTS